MGSDSIELAATYSNLENHPRLIRARQTNPVLKIKLDPKTGLPVVEPSGRTRSSSNGEPHVEVVPSRGKLRLIGRSTKHVKITSIFTVTQTTTTRSKNETPEEKKARKQAVKQERQTRRADKKASKEQFSAEVKNQQKILNAKEKSKMRKL